MAASPQRPGVDAVDRILVEAEIDRQVGPQARPGVTVLELRR